MVNASRPGWLTTVRKIMTNDTFYEHFLRRATRRARKQPPDEHAFRIADNFHCQWHNGRFASQPPRRVVWEPCHWCEGEVEGGITQIHTTQKVAQCNTTDAWAYGEKHW